jgi:hypothetical protein
MLTRPVPGREIADVHAGRIVGAAENAESMARLGRSRHPGIVAFAGSCSTARSQREQLPYLGFLAELVMAECDDRNKRRAAPELLANSLRTYFRPFR